MNFFEHQAQARASTKRLVFLFILAVIFIVAAVDAVIIGAFIAGEANDPEAVAGGLVIGTVITLLIIGIASLVKTSKLRSGGAAVAKALGATEVPADTRDFQLRRLRNVVEEMAIASGTPVPAVYVMENEPGINAFAAGWTPTDAVVAVTRGALDQLRRDELQGVIAHEFSHVLNGDMRLNIRLMGVLFGILVIAIIGEKILRHGGRGGGNRKGGGQIALLGLGLLVVGWVGVFFGRWIKAGVSRSREFLADASAVQFTRDPVGLSTALKKLAGLQAGSKLQTGQAEDVSHMLFGDGIGRSMFATHPPLEQRIQKMEPTFKLAQFLEGLPSAAVEGLNEGRSEDGELPVSAFAAPAAAMVMPAGGAADGSAAEPARATATAATQSVPAAAAKAAPATIARAAPTATPVPDLPPDSAPSVAATPAPQVTNIRADGAMRTQPAGTPPPAASIVARIGELSLDHVQLARAQRAALPAVLRETAHDPQGASHLLLALVMSTSESTAEHQRALLAPEWGASLPRIAALHEQTKALPPLCSLPLAAMALPALRTRPKSDFTKLRTALRALIHADARVEVFEYALGAMLDTQLGDLLSPSRRAADPLMTLDRVQPDVELLLAVFAEIGHAGPTEAAKAFHRGLGVAYPKAGPRYEPAAGWQGRLDAALARLDVLPPMRKQQVVDAIVATVSHDGVVTSDEYELLRAVCASLHCPLPPLG